MRKFLDFLGYYHHFGYLSSVKQNVLSNFETLLSWLRDTITMCHATNCWLYTSSFCSMCHVISGECFTGCLVWKIQCILSKVLDEHTSWWGNEVSRDFANSKLCPQGGWYCQEAHWCYTWMTVTGLLSFRIINSHTPDISCCIEVVFCIVFGLFRCCSVVLFCFCLFVCWFFVFFSFTGLGGKGGAFFSLVFVCCWPSVTDKGQIKF